MAGSGWQVSRVIIARSLTGVQVVAPWRAAVDLGRTVDRADALVVADAALATGTTREQLEAVVRHAHGWPGAREAAWVVTHADPYAESALETLGRLTFIEGDVPVPVSNAWIDLGDVRVRPDHLLDELWMLADRFRVAIANGAPRAHRASWYREPITYRAA